MKNLIGKKCLIKYDINLMLDSIYIITGVNEDQRWIHVNNNRWYREEAILKIGTDEELNSILSLHRSLTNTYNKHREIEADLRKTILEYIEK